MRTVPERDWKKLFTMKSDVLNFACECIFEKIDKIMEERKEKAHETYLKLWKLLREEDQKIAVMFDDLKRNNALHKLAAWEYNGIISKESFAEFSKETQQAVNRLNETLR
jgi:hypothetical protein